MTRTGAAVIFGSATAGAAAAAGWATSQGVGTWYRRQKRPPFQPPDAAFGPVWTTLYTAMAVSAWRVWRRPPTPARSRALRWWWVQLGLNAAWSELFFHRRLRRMALADIGLLAGSIAAFTRNAAGVDPPAAALMVPYLVWTGYAALLNGANIRLNPARPTPTPPRRRRRPSRS